MMWRSTAGKCARALVSGLGVSAAVIAAETVWTLVPGWGLFWLIAGGVAYTAGAVFFMAERIRYFHFVWHLFVVAGTACHFIAVLRYAT